MKRALVVGALAAFLAAPSAPLLAVAVLSGPAQGQCLDLAASVVVGDVPDEITATTANGETITLDQAQLAHARTIIEIGSQTSGVGHHGIVVALTAALAESGLRTPANTTAHPDSASYPNDGDGPGQGPLGLFQMRPASGWGTAAELTGPAYQAQAFYGSPTGPNHGSPPGLLDIHGWEHLSAGEAAQAVELSDRPDRYTTWEPVARTVLSALTVPAAGPGAAETSRVVMPLAAGTYLVTSGFGARDDPLIAGAVRTHYGTDFAAPDGTPVLAVADGVVTAAGPSPGGQNRIEIAHTIAGKAVVTRYLHMWDHGVHAAEGDRVVAGQHIADIGSQGRATGPHLHFEVRPGGNDQPAVDPEPWLAAHSAGHLDRPGPGGPSCAATVGLPAAPTAFTGRPDRTVPDPTGTGGLVTAQTAHLISQARPAFPGSSWSCWSPRPGTVSEHPQGRACDVTFGNPIGAFPAPDAVAEGWRLTNWLQAHADTLGVEYLIWQGHIWSTARDREGWRPYHSSAHDTAHPTGGHYDHLHITTLPKTQ